MNLNAIIVTSESDFTNNAVEKPGRRKGSCSGTTIGKLVTQQVGDELQLQENEINITIYYAQNICKTNVEKRSI